MDTSFHLRTGCSQLKSNIAFLYTLLKSCNIFGANVLERVLYPDMKIRQECLDTSLILDIARNALRYLNSATLGKVTRRRRVIERDVFLRCRIFTRSRSSACC